MQERETEVVWTHEEMRPRIDRKEYSGDGTTWEKKKMKTEAEMDGLCHPIHYTGQHTMKSVTESHPIIKWERLEEEEAD